jgi:hypothetical protein
VADHGTVTTRHHRSPSPRHPGRWRRTEQEHPAVQPLEGAGFDAMPDSARAEPSLQQLRERDHIVLPTGNSGDLALHSVHLLVTQRRAA